MASVKLLEGTFEGMQLRDVKKKPKTCCNRVVRKSETFLQHPISREFMPKRRILRAVTPSEVP